MRPSSRKTDVEESSPIYIYRVEKVKKGKIIWRKRCQQPVQNSLTAVGMWPIGQTTDRGDYEKTCKPRVQGKNYFSFVKYIFT